MSAVYPRVASAAMTLFFLLGPPQPAEAQTTHTVHLLLHSFSPNSLVVRLGDTVRWVWDSDFHNVESGTVEGFKPAPDGRFRSGDPDVTGATFDLTFDRSFLDAHPSADSGYPYYCIVHYFEGMTAVIEVVVPGDADADTDVDGDDLVPTIECLSGPDEAPPPGCLPEELLRMDADGDGDVDLRDLADFQLSFRE